MKPRFLITGASGYLGGHCVLHAPKGAEIFAMYHSNKPTEDYGVNWLYGDLLDETLPIKLLNDIKPQAIIHNAAFSKPDDCERSPELAHELNVEATDRFAAAARRLQAKLVFLSSEIVFDGEHPPYNEQSTTEPVCLYGTTKLLGEQRILARSKSNLVVRPAVIYGSPGIFGSNFALTMIQHWEHGHSTPVFTDQIRNHVSVTWLAKVLFALSVTDLSGIINLGSIESTSRAKFGYRLAEHLGISSMLLTETSYVGKLQGRRPRDLTLDIRYSESVLPENLQPLTLAQGLALEWQKAS